MTSPIFKKLEVEGWRQFDDVEIDLHPQLTVITGANGSGKSTLLNIFTQHFGWNRNYLATPIRDKLGNTSYASGIIQRLWHKLKFSPINPSMTKIGQISYSDHRESHISVQLNQSVQYGLHFDNRQTILGIHFDSYRSPPIYSPVSTIPLIAMTAEQAFNNYNSEMVQRFNSGQSQFSPLFRMKEALISMAVFGEGNKDIGRNQKMIDIFKGFNETLKKVLPKTLGFQHISVRAPEVVLVTNSGEFMIDASSGGIMTLIDLTWRIYMFSQKNPQFVVTMDEPENHLHPSMQRSIMRCLLEAFPKVQFIVATHSPFIVSSVKESNVYVLMYHDDSLAEFTLRNSGIRNDEFNFSDRIKSLKLSNLNKAANTSDILRKVLGVPATMPEWVEDGLNEIVAQFDGQVISTELLRSLRLRLSEFGYAEYYPQALASLTKS